MSDPVRLAYIRVDDGCEYRCVLVRTNHGLEIEPCDERILSD